MVLSSYSPYFDICLSRCCPVCFYSIRSFRCEELLFSDYAFDVCLSGKVLTSKYILLQSTTLILKSATESSTNDKDIPIPFVSNYVLIFYWFLL